MEKKNGGVIENFVIKNVNLGQPRKEDDIDANLMFFAPNCLDDFYRYSNPTLERELGLENPTSMERMMAVLPYVADYYELNKDALLKEWTANQGMMHLMSGR